MTRINCVPVSEIHTKQLHGEYRELPHVFGHVARMIAAGRTKPVRAVPDKFTMGPGHVAFFMDKLGYCLTRYNDICNELEDNRGFNLASKRDLATEFAHIPAPYWKQWLPDAEARTENWGRINQRLAERAMRKVTGERYGSGNGHVSKPKRQQEDEI